MLGQVLEVGAQFLQMQVGAQFVDVPTQLLQRPLQGVVLGAPQGGAARRVLACLPGLAEPAEASLARALSLAGVVARLQRLLRARLQRLLQLADHVQRRSTTRNGRAGG